MSIFRKRSGSQSSFSHGADEISVSKIVPDVMFRECRSDTMQSTRSSCSDIDPSDFTIHDSCVVRNFPKHKSSHLRFLAWVAYTRKYTDEGITDIERRTCPLLWCREQFPDQDSMLKHVWNCPHLSKGLYWCFHCQKPERVGKFQCKRCQGVPSRTDRMASVAKKIFSKLGAKANRHDHYAHSTEGGRSWANFQTSESSKYGDHKGSKLNDDSNDWNHQYIQELPSTSICPEMPGDWTAASHELPDTNICEMIGSEIPIEMGMGAETWDENFYTASLEDWEMPPPPVPRKNTSPRPATLRVDTSFSSLTASMYQGRIPQQRHASHWPETPLSPAIISPLSAGPVFSATSIEVSPTDSDVSGNSFFTDSGYSSATTTISAWNMPVMCEQPMVFEDKRGKKRTREEDEPVFEDWIHDSAFDGQTMLTTASTEVVLAKPPSASQELVYVHNDCGLGPKPRLFTAHWCDAPTLVHSFSEALDAHISHTKSTLQQLPRTSITQELLAMSKTSMVSIGLEVLAGIIEGRKPTAIVQVFAFTHIACAFVIATEQSDEEKVVRDAWFRDVLSWADELGSVKQRGLYAQIAKAIWEPATSFENNGKQPQSQGSSSKNQENALFGGCKQFLDVLGSFRDSDAGNGQYMADISLIKELLPEESDSDDEEAHNRIHTSTMSVQNEEALFDLGFNDVDLYSSGDEASLAQFMKEADNVLQNSLSRNSSSSSSYVSHSSISRQTSNSSSQSYRPHPTTTHHITPQYFTPNHSAVQQQMERVPSYLTHQNLSTPSLRLTQPSPPAPQPSPLPTPSHNRSLSTSRCVSPFERSQNNHHPRNELHIQPSAPPSPVSANTSRTTCALCGYAPTGEEKWKASNLRRHKRTQHPELCSGGKAKVYNCLFPGCVSTFTRSDNLRSHQRDKGHGGMVLGGYSDVEREGEDGEREGEARFEKEKERGGKKRRLGREEGMRER